MSDAVDRPRYGAYATPEQQAEARGTEPPVEVVEPGHPVVAEAPRPRQFDRIAAMMLLGLGFLNVVSSIPGWLRMPETLQLAYDQLGLGTFTATDVASSLGIVAVIIQAVLWIVTLLITMLLIRRRRLSWWVPVVGGVVSFLAITVIVYIALAGDPAFLASLQN